MTANIQISGKATNGIIFVVGGDNFDDFYANLVSVLGDQNVADSTLNAAKQLISTPGSAPASQQSAPQQSSAPRQSTPPPGQSTPSCQHGSRVWKVGGGGDTGKKAWKAWMCPEEDRSLRCEPQWVR